MEIRYLNNIKVPALLVNLNETYGYCLDLDKEKEKENVCKAALGTWRLRNVKATQIEYVFATYQQTVVGVFAVDRVKKICNDFDENDFPAFPHFRTLQKEVVKYALEQKVNYDGLSAEMKELCEKYRAAIQPNEPSAESMFDDWMKRWYFIPKNDAASRKKVAALEKEYLGHELHNKQTGLPFFGPMKYVNIEI